MTRIQVDKLLLDEIWQKRDLHKVFTTIEKENPSEKKWYINTQKEEFRGPYNTFEMDQFYQNFKLNKNCKIKTIEQDNYLPLARYVKRYYKYYAEEQFQMRKTKSKLADNIQKFKKGKVQFVKNREIEYYHKKQRAERVFSFNITPSLIFLNDLLPERFDEQEQGECFYNKLRAQTLKC